MQNKVLKHKKNINLNKQVISHLMGNPAECKSLLNIMPLDSRVKPENDREVGGSMVEMLGVLAVMGVLSVAGIAGYNNAMNKYRANEILNEASKRAVVVAAQAMMGRTGSQLSVAEFGDNAWSVTTENLTNQFGIKSPLVGAEVCRQVVNSVGTGTLVRKVLSGATDATNDASKCADATITFVYNNDMSTVDITPAQVTCEDSEKEEKTYYIGACCNVAIKGKFCPGEDVPTCTKMDEDACACPSINGESCCNAAGGIWHSLSCGAPSNYGSCELKAANTKCSSCGHCANCLSNEIPVCEDYACTCGITEESAACARATCISCPANQKAVCTFSSCTCEDL